MKINKENHLTTIKEKDFTIVIDSTEQNQSLTISNSTGNITLSDNDLDEFISVVTKLGKERYWEWHKKEMDRRSKMPLQSFLND